MKILKPAFILAYFLMFGNIIYAQTSPSSTATNNKEEDNTTLTHTHTDASGNSYVVTHSKSATSEHDDSKHIENSDFLKLGLNSSATSLTINLNYKSNNCTSISVTNQEGKTVMETCIFDASSTVLDVAKLTSGTYSLKAEGEKGVAVQTFKK